MVATNGRDSFSSGVAFQRARTQSRSYFSPQDPNVWHLQQHMAVVNNICSDSSSLNPQASPSSESTSRSMPQQEREERLALVGMTSMYTFSSWNIKAKHEGNASKLHAGEEFNKVQISFPICKSCLNLLRDTSGHSQRLNDKNHPSEPC